MHLWSSLARVRERVSKCCRLSRTLLRAYSDPTGRRLVCVLNRAVFLESRGATRARSSACYPGAECRASRCFTPLLHNLCNRRTFTFRNPLPAPRPLDSYWILRNTSDSFPLDWIRRGGSRRSIADSHTVHSNHSSVFGNFLHVRCVFKMIFALQIRCGWISNVYITIVDSFQSSGYSCRFVFVARLSATTKRRKFTIARIKWSKCSLCSHQFVGSAIAWLLLLFFSHQEKGSGQSRKRAKKRIKRGKISCARTNTLNIIDMVYAEILNSIFDLVGKQ